MFLNKWIFYPIIFTLCFVIYYFFYILMTFRLPIINYRKEYKNEVETASIMSMSIADFAHVLSVYAVTLGIAIAIFFIFFKKHIS